jgi:hypothetical protein
MTDLSDSRQQNYYTPNNQQITQKQSSFNQNQFIIFDEIGEMASQMMYIHVNVPLNLSLALRTPARKVKVLGFSVFSISLIKKT